MRIYPQVLHLTSFLASTLTPCATRMTKASPISFSSLRVFELWPRSFSFVLESCPLAVGCRWSSVDFVGELMVEYDGPMFLEDSFGVTLLDDTRWMVFSRES